MDYNNIYIEVCDKSGFLGAILIEVKNDNPYYASTYIHTLDWIESMLYNMNKELISKVNDISRELFALRLLETISLFGDKRIRVPKRTKSTAIIVEKLKGFYYFDNPVNHTQTISLDIDEAKMLLKEANCTVYVDLYTKTVNMREFLVKWRADDYSRKRNVDISNMSSFVDGLEKLPTWITSFLFNQIDDLRDTVTKNRKGFHDIYGNENIIVVK